MTDNQGPPPSYDEAQTYPQYDASGQMSNLGPPLSQTGSIFTYNTDTATPPGAYSSQPAGPPPITGIPPRRPGAPPPEYVGRAKQYAAKTQTYGAQFGGFAAPPEAQYGSPAAGYSAMSTTYGPGPTAPVVAGYQPSGPYAHPTNATASGVVYNPSQGTVQTVMPAGYNTTPLAYGKRTENGFLRNRTCVRIIYGCSACGLLCFIILFYKFCQLLAS
ncbi:galectin-3-like isoform X1 [Haliotis asinina]|uniref:galectin-3-like isoform X1 n=1 Tax=Haliotis asinina TaxID=109174 RepID=UPI0035324DA2